MAGRIRRFWTEGVGSFIIAVGIALFIRWAFVEIYVTASSSMLPSLYVNDHIFVNKIVYGLRVPFSEDWIFRFRPLRRGEVVVFKYPGDTSRFYIKRVVGVAKDRVFYENGNLYINEDLMSRNLPLGKRREDSKWLRDADFPGEENAGGAGNYTHWQEDIAGKNYSILLRSEGVSGLAFGPYVVPENHFFVMGDNRDNSRDSRLWDSRTSKAKGRVVFKYTGPALKSPVEIPQGSVVKTSPFGGQEERFRIVESAVLKNGEVGAEVSVEVEALVPGNLGNVAANTINVIEESVFKGGLNDQNISVANPEPLSGGEDLRFVPMENLVGRAMFVWMSCEETLSFAPFICNPLKMRWSRFFHRVD